jgi:hypothetical protein
MRLSALVQTDPRTHPAFHAIDTGSFLWVKRPEPGVNPSSAEVKERVELRAHLFWAFMASRAKFNFIFQ